MATTPQPPNNFAPTPPAQGQSPCPPGQVRVAGQCRPIQTSQQPGTVPGQPAAGGGRQARYSAEQKAGFRAQNRKAGAGAKYGYDYASQGYKPQKEAGQAFLNKQDLKFRTFGAFTPTSWDMKCATGGSLEGCPPEQLMLKAKAKQVGRQAEGFADWRPASEVLPGGHYAALVRSNQRFGAQRQAFRAANPNADFSHWTAYRFAQGLKPATPEAIAAAGFDPAQLAGMDIRMLPSGELRTATGQNLDDTGRPIGFRSSATGQPLEIGGAPGGAGGAAGPRGTTPQGAPGFPGAGGPLGAPGAPGTGQPGDLQDEITQYLRQIVQGGGPFGDAETASQLAGARSATEGAAQTAREQAQFDLIRSGMARSPAVARRTYADIQRGGAQDYARAATQIRLERASKNFEARMQALNGMAQQLQGARQYAIAQAQTELERRRIAQNYDLALRNIAMARDQMAQQMSQFNQSLALQRDQFGLQQQEFDWTRTQGSCPVRQPDGTTVTVPIPCSQLAGGFM